MTPTVTPTTLYILCYRVAHETGGLIDGKVYSDPGDASFALATHRRNHHEGFATDEELQAAADAAVERMRDDLIGIGMMESGLIRCGTPRGDRSRYEELLSDYRSAWVEDNSWMQPKHKEHDRLIVERWSISDYTCWVREVSLVTASGEIWGLSRKRPAAPRK